MRPSTIPASKPISCCAPLLNPPQNSPFAVFSFSVSLIAWGQRYEILYTLNFKLQTFIIFAAA